MSGPSTSFKQQHNNNFHLLRHIAAFFVLYAHAVTAFGNREFFNNYSGGRIELSRIGVRIFFIVSGFLVTKSLLQSPGRFAFARKRFLRLWPALFAVTFCICFVLGPLYTTLSLPDYFSSSRTWTFFVRNILFLPVYQLPGVFLERGINGTFWTLFLEVICYSILFIAGKNVLIKYRKAITVLWSVLIAVLYLFPPVIVLLKRIPFCHYLLNDYMALFFSAALWQINTKYRQLTGKVIYLTALAMLIFTWVFPVFNSKFAFAQYVALSLFVIEFGRSRHIIKWPAFDISYGVYLIGFSVQMVMYHYLSQPITSNIFLFISTLFITIPLAFALWFGVEKPALLRK